jgi:branched-chain amino acid transport system ATP-binding protein
MSASIEVIDVSRAFGGVRAVNHCTLKVEAGSITGLIGPNGAGKTTLFNIVAGAIRPDSGRVLLAGEDITGLPPHVLFHKGLVRTFQIPHEFSTLTALENLMVVPPHQPGERLLSAWLRPSLVRDREAEVRARAREVLDFLNLSHVRNELAGNLSGGQKKLLELGRTMMTEARTVLLDEIAAGVNRTLLKDLLEAIRRLNREAGYTFFVIEHDMDMIGALCDPVIVMAQGSVMRTGSLDELREDPEVIEAYFGGPVKAPGAPTAPAAAGGQRTETAP